MPQAHTIEFVQPNIHQIRENDRSDFDDSSLRRVRSGVITESSSPAHRYRRGSIRADGYSSGDLGRTPTFHSRLESSQYRGFPRTSTIQSARPTAHPIKTQKKDEEFGGFPYPHVLLTRLFLRFFPRVKRHLTHSLTIPQTMTIHSIRTSQVCYHFHSARVYLNLE